MPFIWFCNCSTSQYNKQECRHFGSALYYLSGNHSNKHKLGLLLRGIWIRIVDNVRVAGLENLTPLRMK